MVYIASFDIGKKNFAFYVENIPSEEIEGWNKNKVPIKNKYYKDGTMMEEWKSIVDEICFSGITVLSKNYDLTEGQDIKTINRTVYNNMYKVLDLHKDVWDKCSYFVIEKQMSEQILSWQILVLKSIFNRNLWLRQGYVPPQT